jgi:hypothetical protein
MASDQISLTTIYVECNNHLREMDKLRDQLISFYLIVVGAFLAIVKTNLLDDFVKPTSLLLSAFGIIITFAIIEFRIWHTRYSYTAQLLVALSRENKADHQKTEEDERRRSHDELHVNPVRKIRLMTLDWLWNRYIKGTEFWTFTASLTITLFPLYLLLNYYFHELNIQFPVLYCILIYFLVFQLYAAQKTYRSFAECPWAKWLLQGIYRDINLTYNT